MILPKISPTETFLCYFAQYLVLGYKGITPTASLCLLQTIPTQLTRLVYLYGDRLDLY